MAISFKLLPAILLLLLVATEMGAVVAINVPGVCQVRCHKCVGACSFDDECSIMCRNEGNNSGECRGAHHRCICYKSPPCSSPPPPGLHQ
ncbi:hypothetical protein ACP4OV_006831 [Aristida adscensionis]